MPRGVRRGRGQALPAQRLTDATRTVARAVKQAFHLLDRRPVEDAENESLEARAIVEQVGNLLAPAISLPFSEYERLFGGIQQTLEQMQQTQAAMLGRLDASEQTQAAMQQTLAAMQQTQAAMQQTQVDMLGRLDASEQTQAAMQQTQAAMQQTQVDMLGRLDASEQTQVAILGRLEKFEDALVHVAELITEIVLRENATAPNSRQSLLRLPLSLKGAHSLIPLTKDLLRQLQDEQGQLRDEQGPPTQRPRLEDDNAPAPMNEDVVVWQNSSKVFLTGFWEEKMPQDLVNALGQYYGLDGQNDNDRKKALADFLSGKNKG